MGVKALPATRIQLPDDIPIPQPIWVLLATLAKAGVTDQGLTYIPQLRHMENAEAPTEADYTAVDEGFSIDFLATWMRIEEYHAVHPEQQPEREWGQDSGAVQVQPFEYPRDFPIEDGETHLAYTTRLHKW